LSKIIITCGKKKSITISRAEFMYVGSHFKDCLKWAKSKEKNDNIYILSAKYGLLKLSDIIKPYDLKMGEKGCVSSDFIKNQAKEFGILDCEIISTAGREYRMVLDKVFKNIKYPFYNLSLGYMKQAIQRDIKC